VRCFKPQDAPLKQNTRIYILAHPSREAAAKIESVFADPTDYSPMK
jgi:hypothetical protein